MAVIKDSILGRLIPELRVDPVWAEFFNAILDNSDVTALYEFLSTLPEYTEAGIPLTFPRDVIPSFKLSDIPFQFRGGSMYNLMAACAASDD